MRSASYVGAGRVQVGEQLVVAPAAGEVQVAVAFTGLHARVGVVGIDQTIDAEDISRMDSPIAPNWARSRQGRVPAAAIADTSA